MEVRCPKCGGPGGVEMFLSISPCDACLSPVKATSEVEYWYVPVTDVSGWLARDPISAGRIALEISFGSIEGYSAAALEFVGCGSYDDYAASHGSGFSDRVPAFKTKIDFLSSYILIKPTSV